MCGNSVRVELILCGSCFACVGEPAMVAPARSSDLPASQIAQIRESVATHALNLMAERRRFPTSDRKSWFASDERFVTFLQGETERASATLGPLSFPQAADRVPSLFARVVVSPHFPRILLYLSVVDPLLAARLIDDDVLRDAALLGAIADAAFEEAILSAKRLPSRFRVKVAGLPPEPSLETEPREPDEAGSPPAPITETSLRGFWTSRGLEMGLVALHTLGVLRLPAHILGELPGQGPGIASSGPPEAFRSPTQVRSDSPTADPGAALRAIAMQPLPDYGAVASVTTAQPATAPVPLPAPAQATATPAVLPRPLASLRKAPPAGVAPPPAVPARAASGPKPPPPTSIGLPRFIPHRPPAPPVSTQPASLGAPPAAFAAPALRPALRAPALSAAPATRTFFPMRIADPSGPQPTGYPPAMPPPPPRHCFWADGEWAWDVEGGYLGWHFVGDSLRIPRGDQPAAASTAVPPDAPSEGAPLEYAALD